MSPFTFKRGIHPDDQKLSTSQKPIQMLTPPETLYFPLKQHLGAPLSTLVGTGDYVRMGQKLADSEAPLSVPLHSSVSGTVEGIIQKLQPAGYIDTTIVIKNDGTDTTVHSFEEKSIDKLSKQEIIKKIREAGIVGMGGAGFPTHIKLSPPPEKNITHILINGAECEPYLTSDHRVMLETPEEVLKGVSVMMRLFSSSVKAIIGIEDNKKDAIKLLTEKAKGYPGIEVKSLSTKYPQGGERQMIYALLGREVPSGKLPADVGCIVVNIDTATAIYRAVCLDKPLFRRIVTVSGDGVKEPGNFNVRIGTPFKDVIDAAGGLTCPPGKIIMGGPMMGIAQTTLDVPVTKGTSAILVFSEKMAKVGQENPCIRCGRCISVCPMNLRPILLNAYYLNGNWEKLNDENIRDCIECGCCSYICPAKRYLVQSIRDGKVRMNQHRKK